MDFEIREIIQDVTILLIAIACIGNGIQIMRLSGVEIESVKPNKNRILRRICSRLGLKFSSGKAKKEN